MPLTDTFARQIKHSGKPTADKHTDGAGMYLLGNPAGKSWRLDYTYLAKRKTLALTLGYTLMCPRQRREKARQCWRPSAGDPCVQLAMAPPQRP